MKITEVRTVLSTGPCSLDPYIGRTRRSASFIDQRPEGIALASLVIIPRIPPRRVIPPCVVKVCQRSPAGAHAVPCHDAHEKLGVSFNIEQLLGRQGR
jgi:hypothetical protein